MLRKENQNTVTSTQRQTEISDIGQSTPSITESNPKFTLELENFAGPLDLLLSLINKNQLDITEVALAQVTEEFLAYMQVYPNLSQASEFLVIAATLLDIKASQLLPGSEIEEEDLEYIEARDLLFARLLQYRAFKQVAAAIAEQIEEESGYYPRRVKAEPQFAKIVPKLQISIDPIQLAIRAAAIFSYTPEKVSVEHLHLAQVSLKDQAQVVVQILRKQIRVSFSQLVEETKNNIEVVTRFLALLELYRQGSVSFEQKEALGELLVNYHEDCPPDFSQIGN